MNKKKSVALFYLYGQKNAGDAAIGLGALSFLKNRGYKIVAVSRWPNKFPEFFDDKSYYQKKFPDVDVVGGPFYFRRGRGLIESVYSLTKVGVNFLIKKEKTKIKDYVKNSDLIVINGGNLIRCSSLLDLLRLVAFLYPIFLAKKYGKFYIILPQSTSKINFLGKTFLRYVFSDAKKIWARELSSLERFKSYFDVDIFSYAPDMAMNIVKDEDYCLPRKNENGLKIAITMRSFTLGDINEFSKEKTGSIVADILDIVLCSVDVFFVSKIILVVQCDKDLNVTSMLLKDLKSCENIKGIEVELCIEKDTMALLDLYNDVDFLLGMRLHSIILALSVGTPSAGFFDRSWGLKNPGLMERFNMPYAFVGDKLEEVKIRVNEVIEKRVLYSGRILETKNMDLKKFIEEFDGVIK